MRQHNSPCGTTTAPSRHLLPPADLHMSWSLCLRLVPVRILGGSSKPQAALDEMDVVPTLLPSNKVPEWGMMGTLPARCDNVGQCWSLNRSLFRIQCVCSMLGNSLCSSTFGHCHCHGLDNLSQRFHDMLSSRSLKHSKDGVSALVSTWYQHGINIVPTWSTSGTISWTSSSTLE